MNRDKIIKALERCEICDMSLIASEKGQKAYIECEYTTGLYCRKDKLIHETISFLKNQPEIVRCKDCKWRGTNACFCKAKDDVQDDWFCSEGDRR